MTSEVWMRKRQNKEKINYTVLVRHVKSGEHTLNGKIATEDGWIINSVKYKSDDVRKNFIPDSGYNLFVNRSCNIKLAPEDVAKAVLLGEINAKALQTI